MSTKPGGAQPRGGANPRGNPRDLAELQQEQAARRTRERRLLGLTALVLVVLVVGGVMGVQYWRAGRSPSVVTRSTTTASFAPVTLVSGQPIRLGVANAPVRVQLYEDFRCRHCAELESKLGPTLTREQDAGRVAVELYPMSFVDEGSRAAANAMACAAESGFGQAYYLGLFANSELTWSDGQLLDLAGQVQGSVPESFATCVKTDAHQAWLNSITAAAETAGVTATPTMFLDGKPVDVATVTPASLTAAVQSAAGPAAQ